MKLDQQPEVDLNLLVALEALLSEANVTRAAQKAGLTQSAMSHKLRRLRELLDDPLLVGGRGGMKLTPRAAGLLGPLRQNLRELRSLVGTARPFDPATARRNFTVISTDFAEFQILPRVLEFVAESAPHITITMREPWPGLAQGLEDGSADVMMGSPVQGSAGLVQRKVAEDELVCMVRRDHPRVGDILDLETFVTMPHLQLSADGGPGLVDDALALLGLKRHVALRIPHFLGAPFVVAQSNLVVTISRAVAEHARRRFPVRVLAPPIELPSSEIWMTWHERFSRDPGHRWLRELCHRFTLACVEPDPACRRARAPRRGRTERR